MNIKNYTSSVPAEHTISQIESKLAASGASGIMKLYNPAGRVSSLVFKTELGGKSYTIRVPANIQKCFDALWKDYCKRVSRPKESTKGTIMAQAERTAWRIVQEWIEIQLSMIYMNQAQFLEVFMPYVFDGKQTFFEYQAANQFKALPANCP
jgi:hypothetical protein